VVERSASLPKPKSPHPSIEVLAQQGIFMSREDLPALPLAFVFPGQGHSMEEWDGISTSPFLSSRSGWIGLQLQRTSTSFTYCSTIERRTLRRPGAATCHVRNGTRHGPIPHHPGYPPCGHGRP